MRLHVNSYAHYSSWCEKTGGRYSRSIVDSLVPSFDKGQSMNQPKICSYYGTSSTCCVLRAACVLRTRHTLRANPNENSIQLRKLTNQIVQNSRLNCII
jgi:hypothetical protein